MKFFNTAGPVNPEKHYCVERDFDGLDVQELIDQEKYFILHAPRQTGKTTLVQKFVKSLNVQETFKALYVNIEPAQAARNNTPEGLRCILEQFRNAIAATFGDNDPAIPYLNKIIKNLIVSFSALESFLQFWAKESEKPLVIFIDEIVALIGDTLISTLRQIRAGYMKDRPQYFPQSICLVGVRDVRDYRIWSHEKQAIILGGSAFNIKAESLRLPDFNQKQVRDLYVQHTTETGQTFTNEAVEHAFYLTQGQPWLVNALAYEACFRDIKDRNTPITKEIIGQAKETLILRRDTHLDSLIDRLKEDRVRRVIDPIIRGTDCPQDVSTEDISYTTDLGLVTTRDEKLQISNPIYQEIIPRELTLATQKYLIQESLWYQNPDGSMNFEKLMRAFQQFYRENSGTWFEKFAYKEAGPHLLLMAFMQRVINGKGKIHREYALGRKRVDLLITWPVLNEKKQRVIIELKVKRSIKTLEDGLRQTADYMDECGATEGHLVIFDRDDTQSWDKKIFEKKELFNNKTITIWGM